MTRLVIKPTTGLCDTKNGKCHIVGKLEKPDGGYNAYMQFSLTKQRYSTGK